MPYSIYAASVLPMSRSLAALSKFTAKAVKQAKEGNIDLNTLLEARLAADMRPFPFQIQSASDAAKGCAARLTGTDAPSFPDTEKTFPELQARIAKTLDYLKTFKPEQFTGAEDREITLKFPNGEMKFNGRDFVAGFALPNFYFHVTTAYALLRHKGIQIGKMDFLGGGS